MRPSCNHQKSPGKLRSSGIPGVKFDNRVERMMESFSMPKFLVGDALSIGGPPDRAEISLIVATQNFPWVFSASPHDPDLTVQHQASVDGASPTGHVPTAGEGDARPVR